MSPPKIVLTVALLFSIPRALAQDLNSYAQEDIPVENGGIVGNYIDTGSSDDVYEQLTEAVGHLSKGQSPHAFTYLTHRWSFEEVPPGYLTCTFAVEAYHTESRDGDDFAFSYSTDGQNYNPMLTVTKTADNHEVQEYQFPYPMHGTIYVQVRDTTRRAVPGAGFVDTVYIDYMYIHATGVDDEVHISEVVGTGHSTWRKLPPEENGEIPEPRDLHAMAYDSGFDKTILFSGANDIADTWAYDYSNNTWELQDTTVVDPDNGPLDPRVGHAMVYDPDPNGTIMFGGLGSSYDENGNWLGSWERNDTWVYEYGAKTWTNRHSTVHPESGPLTGRWHHAMVYDPDDHLTIMVGGVSDTSWGLRETWVYDYTDNQWRDMTPTMLVVDGVLPPIAGQSLAYVPSADASHPEDGRTIMYGGSTPDGGTSDTWAYDYSANTWYNMTPTMTVLGGTLTPRFRHDMVYDQAVGKVVMFGGEEQVTNQPRLDDTWTYDYPTNTWSKKDPVAIGGTLWAREEHAMVYDVGAERTLLFGGMPGSFPFLLNDTWTYSIDDRTAIITWRTDEPADSVVRYGVTPGELTEVSDPTLVLDHQIIIEQLTPGLVYCYEVESTDFAQNTAVDNNGGSYYWIPDTTVPIITDVDTHDVTTSSARVTWTTDEPAGSVVRYGLTPEHPEQWSAASDSAPVTNHSVALGQLSAGTLYYYQVESTDASGNTGIDDNGGQYYSFTTVPAYTMHVDRIDMSYTVANGRYRIYTTVTIVDGTGAALAGVIVDLTLTRPDDRSWAYSGTTAPDGTVTFEYGPTRVTGTYTSEVTGVAKDSWTYAYWENEETTDSWLVP